MAERPVRDEEHRARDRESLKRRRWRSDDFTVVVPLYGHPRFFANRKELKHLKANVLVAMDVTESVMRDFALQLVAEGWQVVCTTMHRPNPPLLIRFALESGQVTTTYVVRVDADTRPLEDIGRYIARIEEDGADVCSAKVHVADPRRQAQKMQALEYRMAMLSRHFRPC